MPSITLVRHELGLGNPQKLASFCCVSPLRLRGLASGQRDDTWRGGGGLSVALAQGAHGATL